MKHLFRVSSSILCIFMSISPPICSLAYRASPPDPKGFGRTLFTPTFSFSWLDDKATFQAGDIATIKVKILDNPVNNKTSDLSRQAMNFSLSVNGKKGNSSYISGVVQYLQGAPTLWSISFIPIWVGQFTMVVTEDHFGITDSSLHFNVTAGHLYPSACVASWIDLSTEYVAGTKANILILPKDAFGNDILQGVEGLSNDYFCVHASYDNGSNVDLFDFRSNGWNEAGYISLEFVPKLAGNFFLHVYGDNKSLSGSPLPLIVKPGPLDMKKSMGMWKCGTNFLQIFSKLEIFVHQQDSFGNLVPGFYPFDARVVKRTTNLSVPVADLFFQVVAEGIQLLSFTVSEPGQFTLIIFDTKANESISPMVYDYYVFIGYCHGSNSFANGSGLAHSIAGRMSFFTVFLEDQYHNPSPIEAERLYVRILCKNGTYEVSTIIFPLRNVSERAPVSGQFYFPEGPSGYVPSLPKNEIIGRSTVRASEFHVAFTARKSGNYEIWVSCGNVAINNESPYLLKVLPGLVSTSLSNVVKFAPSVKRLMKNEVVVQLSDSFLNPVFSQKSKLSLGANNSSFMTWAFIDNEDGTYTGYYMARDTGAFNICILFQDEHLPPCPFEVHVYESKYFSEAHNDSILVWEDESVAFDVLLNDYIAGGQAKLIESSIPQHGSLLLYGQLFRYTPFKGYFGNDSFSYTFSDTNNNNATATVFISVLCKPPQFVSLPTQLRATEDVVSPKFGSGFSGFEVFYSDAAENISVTISARFGTMYLAPMSIYLVQPLGSMLAVNRGGRAGKELTLVGQVETINAALESVQYIGNENFCGNDIINLYAMNKNGVQDARVPIFVEPINDPPIIHAPKSIVLGKMESSDGYQIYDRQRDVFDFLVVEPDIFGFPGNKSHFVITFSLEVNDGSLSTLLPVNLISTAELKITGNDQWQPLQTYVTISNHFVLKGKGFRFRGSVGDCNNALQQLIYQGTNHDAVLTVTVNDMGNYGCYPDCADMMSSPLSTEVTINLIRRRPISSRTTLLLGSALVIEIFMMILLGGVLLFFICKCMNALQKERQEHADNVRFPSEENHGDDMMNASTSANMNPTPSSFALPESSFRQRSRWEQIFDRSGWIK
ncbi:protein GAMETE EXPRESSED 2 isoform X3 [Ananas comosus]|uniref:Protein GAMETE EXPRESSED 2 isoform X3 n=1 Tax=Ananas comosus TaxID=4615 RepID=A0A6P5F2N1_ANACO|nr:protein GAMETE EXPRESSED 2 isoform X3 [Ananas comosus]